MATQSRLTTKEARKATTRPRKLSTARASVRPSARSSAVAGGGKGAAIGGIIGAVGGAGSVYVQGKDNLELPRGHGTNDSVGCARPIASEGLEPRRAIQQTKSPCVHDNSRASSCKLELVSDNRFCLLSQKER